VSFPAVCQPLTTTTKRVSHCSSNDALQAAEVEAASTTKSRLFKEKKTKIVTKKNKNFVKGKIE
jgi:hypothetical protein